MEDIKVVIAVAAYNSGKHIGELLDSLVSQTHKNLKIVVRDDKSSDNTVEIVKERAKADSRISLLDIETEVSSAKENFFTLLLNISLSKNEYLMFSDADDVWKANKVEITLKAMLNAEAQYQKVTPILVHTDLEVVDENLNTISTSLFRYEKLSPKRNSLREILVQNNVTGCTVMINNSLKEKIKENPKDAIMHDWWLALVTASFGKIIVVYEQTILYRQHDNNQIGAYNSRNLINGLKKLSKKDSMRRVYLSMYRQAGCFQEIFEQYLKQEELKIVKEYAEMEYLTTMGRIIRIFRGRYFKNTLLRNIGQFFVI